MNRVLPFAMTYNLIIFQIQKEDDEFAYCYHGLKYPKNEIYDYYSSLSQAEMDKNKQKEVLKYKFENNVDLYKIYIDKPSYSTHYDYVNKTYVCRRDLGYVVKDLDTSKYNVLVVEICGVNKCISVKDVKIHDDGICFKNDEENSPHMYNYQDAVLIQLDNVKDDYSERKFKELYQKFKSDAKQEFSECSNNIYAMIINNYDSKRVIIGFRNESDNTFYIFDTDEKKKQVKPVAYMRLDLFEHYLLELEEF